MRDRYMIILGESGPTFFKLETCPICNGSGRADPHAVLGGRAAGGGVCTSCRGNRHVATVIMLDKVPEDRWRQLISMLQEGRHGCL